MIDELQHPQYLIIAGLVLAAPGVVDRNNFAEAIGHIDDGTRPFMFIDGAVEAVHSSIIIRKHYKWQRRPYFQEMGLLGVVRKHGDNDRILFGEILVACGCVLEKVELDACLPRKDKNEIGPSTIIRYAIPRSTWQGTRRPGFCKADSG